ncbi:hypothetical protein FDUTEX481_04196 [Tolypothrix sp. PCC 7601]|jgi:hypothetical protein|nr:hypothetical protein FDUTEX481_04196 [Tolypothrix sp. PCC 7601]BAY95815.1 hypothetical protein NIES3275_78920 [Microchaete diplosiphon NIES-3275]
MQQLEPVLCPTELQGGAVYQIDGVLYKYLYSDPYARIDHPRFKFVPLPGQRRTADLILNKAKIRKCYLVPGYRASQVSTVSEKAVQMSLF